MNPNTFLTELKSHDKNKFAIVKQVRDLILETNKNVGEEIKYGGLLYSDQKPYTGLFVYKNHVTLEFTDGAEFTDPKNLLEGDGKHRRHVKFTAPDDVNEKIIKQFLRQAIQLQK